MRHAARCGEVQPGEIEPGSCLIQFEHPDWDSCGAECHRWQRAVDGGLLPIDRRAGTQVGSRCVRAVGACRTCRRVFDRRRPAPVARTADRRSPAVGAGVGYGIWVPGTVKARTAPSWPARYDTPSWRVTGDDCAVP